MASLLESLDLRAQGATKDGFSREATAILKRLEVGLWHAKDH
eukprot:CAMPEP_0197554186 /NCGR_PEP_ID=MMETSP1320-20131121/10817_1 /TAXON_ID=91990 /ORGANISM="Bolidomonas sp., Strain RCC2347" /LENGTH=41 /DNA_ID= /DNA_START= /DNA_END= /DNA_ORIENTATION=